ncbi:ceramide synthase isoform X3 [Patagioenas fasciata]|uniref:ceramide synthase isoform X3 n=1 Tax=Patagioenas fasciata TaxID=372321 RepID=UPI003A9A53F5
MSSGTRGEAGSPVLPFSAGLLFFPGLFVLGRCVLRRLRCPEPHAEILAARLVSSVQAVMASTAGYIIASSCHHVIDDQHWLAGWYPPFAVPYFIYDVYAMFLCHRHRARVKGHEGAAPAAPRRAATAFLRRHPLMVLHHAAMVLVCFPVATLWRQGKGDFFLGCLLLAELSTPFVCLGKVLILLELQHPELHKNIWGGPGSLPDAWVPWGTPGSLPNSWVPMSLGPLGHSWVPPELLGPHVPGSLGALLGPSRTPGSPCPWVPWGTPGSLPNSWVPMSLGPLGHSWVPMYPGPLGHSWVPPELLGPHVPGSLGALLGPSRTPGSPCAWVPWGTPGSLPNSWVPMSLGPLGHSWVPPELLGPHVPVSLGALLGPSRTPGSPCTWVPWGTSGSLPNSWVPMYLGPLGHSWVPPELLGPHVPVSLGVLLGPSRTPGSPCTRVPWGTPGSLPNSWVPMSLGPLGHSWVPPELLGPHVPVSLGALLGPSRTPGSPCTRVPWGTSGSLPNSWVPMYLGPLGHSWVPPELLGPHVPGSLGALLGPSRTPGSPCPWVPWGTPGSLPNSWVPMSLCPLGHSWVPPELLGPHVPGSLGALLGPSRTPGSPCPWVPWGTPGSLPNSWVPMYPGPLGHSWVP